MKYENKERNPYTKADGSVHYHIYSYPVIPRSTYRLLESIAEDAISDIPQRFNRKRAEYYNQLIINIARHIDDVLKVSDINVGDKIYYYYSKNFGNKKWSHYIDVVEYGIITSVTPHHVMVQGHRLEPWQVIAVEKEVK